jgi:hypothetical protein
LSLYFFHLRDGVDILLDTEGRELDGREAISQACLYEARAIIADDARNGTIMLDQRIDVQDAAGLVVHTLPFVDAIDITHPRGENLSTRLQAPAAS